MIATEESNPKELRIDAPETSRPVVESKKSITTVTKVAEKKLTLTDGRGQIF
jgi:hypothetical protein